MVALLGLVTVTTISPEAEPLNVYSAAVEDRDCGSPPKALPPTVTLAVADTPEAVEALTTTLLMVPVMSEVLSLMYCTAAEPVP